MKKRRDWCRTVEVGDDSVHGVEPGVLFLVPVHAVVLDLLDETVDVVDGSAVGSLATDALKEHRRVADPVLTLCTINQSASEADYVGD